MYTTDEVRLGLTGHKDWSILWTDDGPRFFPVQLAPDRPPKRGLRGLGRRAIRGRPRLGSGLRPPSRRLTRTGSEGVSWDASGS